MTAGLRSLEFECWLPQYAVFLGKTLKTLTLQFSTKEYKGVPENSQINVLYYGELTCDS